MKTKVTGQQVVNLNNAFAAMEMDGKELPFKVWYAINKTRKSLNNSLSDINDAREKLLDKYALDNGNGHATEMKNGAAMYKFKDDKSQKKFEEEFVPILSEDFELDIHKIKIDYLEGLTASKAKNPFVDTFLDIMLED